MLITTETLLGPDPPPSAYLESYRILRSSLLALRHKEPFQTMLITSSGQREGKTTVAMNLGTMLGLIERSTILIDADFYGGGFGEMLGISESAGLTDVYLGQLELEEALMETDIPSLHILPSGTQTDKGPELALTGSTRSMAQVLDQLKALAEFIICDCTPVRGFATALSLAATVDVVFFVSLARCQVSDVQRCLDSLTEAGANIGGVIVNDVLPSDSAVYRAYHRYYA